MKKMKYLAIASTAVAAMPAFAQSKNFEGSNLSLGVGSMQLKESSDSTSKNWNTGGNIEFTKFKSLNDSWLIGFGVGYDFGTLESKEFGSGSGGGIQYFDIVGLSEFDPGYSDANTYRYQSNGQKRINTKNNLSISFLPAFAVSKVSMIYGRLSYNRAKVSVSGGGGQWLDGGWFEGDGGACSYPDYADAAACIASSSNGASGSKYLNGIGWGLGLRHKFTENLFLQAEYKYVSYKHNAELDVKPNTQGYTLSIGYKF